MRDGAIRASPTRTCPGTSSFGDCDSGFLGGIFAIRSGLALATPITLPVYMLNTGPPLLPA